MELVLAIVAGVLYATGLYLMLRRRLAQLIIGIGLLSNGTNILIFTAGGLTRAHPPVVPDGAELLIQPYADPMPQALILTAIVIGFGVLAFTMVLAFRTNQIVVADDIDRMRGTDALVPIETAELAEPYDEEVESHPDDPVVVGEPERVG